MANKSPSWRHRAVEYRAMNNVQKKKQKHTSADKADEGNSKEHTATIQC